MAENEEERLAKLKEFEVELTKLVAKQINAELFSDFVFIWRDPPRSGIFASTNNVHEVGAFLFYMSSHLLAIEPALVRSVVVNTETGESTEATVLPGDGEEH